MVRETHRAPALKEHPTSHTSACMLGCFRPSQSFQSVPRPTGNRGACLTGLPGSQLVKISLKTASYSGVAVRRSPCFVPVTSWKKVKVRFTFLSAPRLAGTEARARRKPTKCSSEVGSHEKKLRKNLTRFLNVATLRPAPSKAILPG